MEVQTNTYRSWIQSFTRKDAQTYLYFDFVVIGNSMSAQSMHVELEIFHENKLNNKYTAFKSKCIDFKYEWNWKGLVKRKVLVTLIL